jgi:hypothetical protein
MPRSGRFLLLPIAFALVAIPAAAPGQNQPSGSAPSYSLAPDKMMAKEKAVEQHAKKRAECKQQAKIAGLGVIARKHFVRECMAGG